MKSIYFALIIISSTVINSLSGWIFLKLRIIFFEYTNAKSVVSNRNKSVQFPSGSISRAPAAVNRITIAAIAYSKKAWKAFLWLYFAPACKSAISPTMKFSVPNKTIRTKKVITSLVTVSRKARDATRAVSKIPSIILSNIS